MSNDIDEKTKLFLIACLVGGIDVESEPIDFMSGLVDHLNCAERRMWATGDHDGIIIHDKFDTPILLVKYDGEHLSFSIFGAETVQREEKVDAGYMLLNIIGYIQELRLHFSPTAISFDDSFSVNAGNSENDDQNDWSL